MTKLCLKSARKTESNKPIKIMCLKRLSNVYFLYFSFQRVIHFWGKVIFLSKMSYLFLFKKCNLFLLPWMLFDVESLGREFSKVPSSELQKHLYLQAKCQKLMCNVIKSRFVWCWSRYINSEEFFETAE